MRHLSQKNGIDLSCYVSGVFRPVWPQDGNAPPGTQVPGLTHGAGLTNVSAGEHLAMSPVAVTKALRWVENQLATDAKGGVYRWIFLLKDLKGQ